MSLSWEDAAKVAVMIVLLQTLVSVAADGVDPAVANHVVGVGLIVGLGIAVVYPAYRGYAETTSHTRGR